VGKPYSKELEQLADTVAWASAQDVEVLQRFLARWDSDFTVVVGSGGSYSAATVISLLREYSSGSPTRALTPLDFQSMAFRVPCSRALLISAEGKNADIIAAARWAIAADKSVAAITLTKGNPLAALATRSASIRIFDFEMTWGKDGYLATNSLLGTVLLLFRTLLSQEAFDAAASTFLSRDALKARRALFLELPELRAATSRSILLTHTSAATPFAIDLESKLSEAAIAVVERVDLRQFAHGRHLQLGLREQKPLVIVAHAESDARLATETRALLPASVLSVQICVPGKTEAETAVAGLVDAMYVTEAMSRDLPYDPGQPVVPQFGRDIHKLDPVRFLKDLPKVDRVAVAVRRKHLGGPPVPALRPAADAFLLTLRRARLRGIVCDFDGTLCRAENRFSGIDSQILERLVNLLSNGLVIGIASGRGDSIYEDLRKRIPNSHHHRVLLGCYSGSCMQTLDEPFGTPPPNTAFRSLLDWLQTTSFANSLRSFDDVVRGGQLSVRFESPSRASRLRSAVARWIEDRRNGWRVFSSGHSVDVLDENTSKRTVVDRMAALWCLDAKDQLLRIGDSGHEDGNDFEFLNDGLSLSADSVSLSLTACWNFARSSCNQAEATLSYLSALVSDGKTFRFDVDRLLTPSTDA
jgi:fructoselysine-6-P-deglycase FrlB-like protein/hydroxymethylpyrimidine pyrophosphatase-like HAD family hydrolase